MMCRLITRIQTTFQQSTANNPNTDREVNMVICLVSSFIRLLVRHRTTRQLHHIKLEKLPTEIGDVNYYLYHM